MYIYSDILFIGSAPGMAVIEAEIHIHLPELSHLIYFYMICYHLSHFFCPLLGTFVAPHTFVPFASVKITPPSSSSSSSITSVTSKKVAKCL